MENKFYNLFKIRKPIIGMIHLSGPEGKKVTRALEELEIYEEEGINGAIIENYIGSSLDIINTLNEASQNNFEIIMGVNDLINPYNSIYSKRFGAKFIQFDSVQSNNRYFDINKSIYEENPEMVFLGGVRFKYQLSTRRSLEEDLEEGERFSDAIVTTGDGTGIETPLEKLRTFKSHLSDFPLIVGAGINDKNAYEQLKISDGAIIGSYFKPDKNTHLKVDKYRVREIVQIAKEARK